MKNKREFQIWNISKKDYKTCSIFSGKLKDFLEVLEISY